jgi:hypothetical protein
VQSLIGRHLGILSCNAGPALAGSGLRPLLRQSGIWTPTVPSK